MRRWMLMVFWFALIAAAAPAQSTGVRADGQTERDGGGVGTVVTPKKPVDEGATESRSLPHVVVALQKAKERAGVTTGAERAAALREVREQVGIAADICEELAAGSQSDADEFGKAAEELKQNAKPSLDAKKAVDSALGKAVRIESDLQQRADSAREIAQKNSGSAVAEGQAKFWFAQWKGIERQTTSLRNLTEATTSDAEMLLVEIEALELTARYSAANADLFKSLGGSYRSEVRPLDVRIRMADKGRSSGIQVGPLAVQPQLNVEMTAEEQKQYEAWRNAVPASEGGKVAKGN